MIYLDVTSACHSALNTGVKRMQRGLHAWLSQRPDYQPVCWQSVRRGYRAIGPRDRERLEPSSTNSKRSGAYDHFAPGLISDALHFFSDALNLKKWPAELKSGDVLLIPDLLWDNRGVYLACLRGTPVRRAGIFHDAIALRLPQQSHLDPYFCARGIRALAELDLVICISKEAESDLHFFWNKFGVKPVPTHVIPWPVPFAGVRPKSEPQFPTKRLLYVARLEAYKNHLRLLTSCEKLWREGLSFELRLIGCKAYPDIAWQILRRVRSLQRAGFAVNWQSHVDEDELHRAYSESSFTVFPSLREGFGLPVIESLWHGRPVVCGINGALGEVAAGGGCETVDTQSEESLTQGLRHLLTDEERYRTLYAETQTRHFRTWKDYGEDLAELLQIKDSP